MKTKNHLLTALAVFTILLIALLGIKPAYLLYRDISFHWEERSEEAWDVKHYAESQNLSIGEWPWEIIDLYETNPETREFVLNWPFRENQEVDITSYDSTQVPLFLQWDPMWGYADYGSSCLAITGCGPTCLAMVGYHLTGDRNMTPDRIAQFAQHSGYYESGYGSSWKLISEGAGKLGMKATELPLVKKKMTDALEAGHPVILAMGKGNFTSSGHYIVLTGVEDGAFRVNDPNSRLRSDKLWTYEELEGQIRNIWALEKA